MRAKVLVLYTGGTIGMRHTHNGLVPDEGFEKVMRSVLGPALDLVPTFDLIEQIPLIDSANLCPSHWQRIAEELIRHYDDYQGFVVLHGTDTLAYTASALSFILQGLNKPVLLTGSQIPLGSGRSDGAENLLGALQLAASPELNEVCVFFRGRLLRGNRAMKVDATALEAFDSPSCPWLGQVGIGIDLNRELLLPPGDAVFSVPEFDPHAVSVLRCFPGMSASLTQAVLGQPGLKGMVLQSYGVGNPPAANRELVEAMEAAVARGTVIVNVSQCHRGKVEAGTYASGAILQSIGVVEGADMTLEAAFAKLHWLLTQGKTPAQIEDLMRQALCGERS